MYPKFLPCLAVALLSLGGCTTPSLNAQSTTASPSPVIPTSSAAPKPAATPAVAVSPESATEAKSEVKPETPSQDRSNAAPFSTNQKEARQKEAGQKEAGQKEAGQKEIATDRDTPEDRNRRIATIRAMDEDVLVLKNQNRTITIRGMQAWSGKNGTGELGYESCDIDGKCLKLEGGTMTCSRGTCGMSWNNGDYSYGLSAPMDNPDRPTPSAGYSLTVVHAGKVILEEEGLKRDR